MGQVLQDTVGFSHLVAVIFVSFKGVQRTDVVVDNMTVVVNVTVVRTCSILVFVDTTVVVNTLAFLSVLVSAELMTGVGVSETNTLFAFRFRGIEHAGAA